MIIQSIQQQILETDVDAVRAQLEQGFGPMPYDPYSYQYATHRVTAEAIRDYKNIGPFIVKAAVSAGKTTLISLACRRITQLRMPALVISRQGEIIEQDAKEMRNFRVESSIFSASLGMKATTFPIICGSEMTVVNGLEGKLADFYPRFLLIDECQHVDVDDLVESERAGLYNKMKAENTLDDMRKMSRKGYTLLIREFQRRCLERYGRELVVIGYTGTDYRGIQPIIQEDKSRPGFWRRAIVDISTEYLVDFGAVVPTTFGAIDEDLAYDLSEFASNGNEGDDEFSNADLEAMQQAILAQGTMTQKIMLDVVEKAKNRNGVLVTCAGRKHCLEAAKALPPGITYGIVTQDCTDKERRKILKDAYEGKCKFVFQVGCLTTGINCPPWDTIVILRKIGSLTLLTQLIGRGMRKLKKEHLAWGMVKEDNQVWDYAGSMDELADLYFSPFLEQYQYAVDSSEGAFKTCPICGTLNGEHARRCRRVDDETGLRCEYFWTSRVCEDQIGDRGQLIVTGCGMENDIVARYCRGCGAQLIDPNKNLERATYTVDDFVKVRDFGIEPTKCGGGIAVKYIIGNDGEESFKAWEVFWPGSDNQGSRQAWKVFTEKHLVSPSLRGKMRKKSITIGEIMADAHLFARPVKVTHRRINNGKKDVITRKVFSEDF